MRSPGCQAGLPTLRSKTRADGGEQAPRPGAGRRSGCIPGRGDHEEDELVGMAEKHARGNAPCRHDDPLAQLRGLPLATHGRAQSN